MRRPRREEHTHTHLSAPPYVVGRRLRFSFRLIVPHPPSAAPLADARRTHQIPSESLKVVASSSSSSTYTQQLTDRRRRQRTFEDNFPVIIMWRRPCRLVMGRRARPEGDDNRDFCVCDARDNCGVFQVSRGSALDSIESAWHVSLQSAFAQVFLVVRSGIRGTVLMNDRWVLTILTSPVNLITHANTRPLPYTRAFRYKEPPVPFVCHRRRRRRCDVVASTSPVY